MSKKKDYKEIKKLAEELDLEQLRTFKRKDKIQFTGASLMLRGVNKVGKDKVHPKDIFEKEAMVDFHCSHEKEMRRIYEKLGMVGVQSYIVEIKNKIAQKAAQPKEETL